jgi:hypothetical protein
MINYKGAIMYKAVKIGNQWFATQINSISENEAENLQSYLENSEPVILTASIEVLEEILDGQEYQMVGEEDIYE